MFMEDFQGLTPVFRLIDIGKLFIVTVMFDWKIKSFGATKFRITSIKEIQQPI